MKDIITAFIGYDHFFECSTKIIARKGESIIPQLKIRIPTELCDYWAYIDFKKADGEKFKTPKLDIIDGDIYYDIPLAVLDKNGDLEAQVVLQKESGEIWKSTVKTFCVNRSIDATEDIPDKEDFIVGAQSLLEEVLATDLGTMPKRMEKLESDLGVERSRINALTTLADGSTTGDAELTDIRVGYDGTIYECAGEAVRGQARQLKGAMEEDLVYVQNPNLYDGEWTVGRWNYASGGGVYTSPSTHCRNVNPVRLDSTKAYNIQTKVEVSGVIFLLKYDDDGAYLGYEQVQNGAIGHIEGVGAINFSIASYSTKYPDTPLYVMVWEDDETKPYTEYLNYGEKSKYYRTSLALNEENMADAMLKRDKAKFDNSFNYIAYSSVTESGVYENTKEHFEWCANQGIFTALKGDIQLTSDNAIIMCHNAGFTLNSENRIVTYNSASATMIHDLTEEECLDLEFATPSSITGEYFHPTNIDTYLFICKKYGLIPYITIRDNYVEDTVRVLLDKLDKFTLRERAIINSFTYETLQAVRNRDANITLSQVRNSNTPISTATIDRAITLGNCMVCGFDFPVGSIENLTEEVMAYAREKDIRIYEAQVDMSHIDALIKLGVAGAQIKNL